MFEFMFVIGLVMAYYGYTVTKNPQAWGDQGRDNIKEENWRPYVRRNGQFIMYGGLLFAGVAALDAIFNLANWLFILLLLAGMLALIYPLCRWMHEKEGTWNPWPHKETEKQKRARLAKEQAKQEKKQKNHISK